MGKLEVITKWTTPEGGGAPLLCQPNIPHPLHKLAPRNLMRASEWTAMRTACYEACERKCEVCGADCPPGAMDAHELYDFDYDSKTSTFIRLVGLCKTCVDKDTEVLTEKGWKKIPEVTCSDKVACWAEDTSIEFLNPMGTVVSHPTEAIKVCYKKHELYFSPEHRLPLQVAAKQSSTYRQTKVVLAKDYKASHYYNWYAGGFAKNRGALLSALERLYIALEADGNICYDKEAPRGKERARARSDRYGTSKYRYTYMVRLGKERKVERFQQLLDESGVKYQQRADQAGEKGWTVWLNVDAKHFANCFNMNMGEEKAREFLEELVFWDGTYTKGTTVWYTNKPEEAAFVQGIACQCNMVATMTIVNRLGNLRKGQWQTPYERLTYAVYLSSAHPVYCGREMVPQRISWDEPMYCITVPTSYFIARRDGLVFVTGNCHTGVIHSGRAVTMYKNHTPLWTKDIMLRAAEHGFELVSKWNKLHKDKKPLKMFSTFLDWLKEPSLAIEMKELIDKYHIEFYDVPATDTKENWGKWKLIYNGAEYYSPYSTLEEWEEAMQSESERQVAQNKNLFEGDVFEELIKMGEK